jgi:hypothetical protein
MAVVKNIHLPESAPSCYCRANRPEPHYDRHDAGHTMPTKKRQKNNPIDNNTYYIFDIADNCNWHGELLYAVNDKFLSKHINDGVVSSASIVINAPLAQTGSKKIHVGEVFDINIYIDDAEQTQLGVIQSSKKEKFIALWLPWQIANHIHMILISGRSKILDLSGTELYRNMGKISSLNISNSTDEDN